MVIVKTSYKRIRYKFGKNKKLDVLVIVIMLCAVALGIYNYIQELSMLAAAFMKDGECEIHMIDVGQGDSVLIRTNEGNVLVDAGTADAEDDLRDYLISQGVRDFDYVVFTHPHEDHIGNGDMIIDEFDVESVIMPDVQAYTRCFEDLLLSIDEAGAELIMAKPKATYKVGGLTLKIFAPIGECDPDDLNNCSIVMRVDYGEVSMLFSGDAEKAVEREVYERYGDELDCDIYKVAHHGSVTSNSDEFFSAASPDLALISCGVGNSYGHPHREIVDMLDRNDITVRRTDVDGDVVVATDGKKYWLKEE